MEVPGLSSDQSNENLKTRVELQSGSEWRFECDFESNEAVTVKLLSGTAEIFGTELAIGAELTFKNAKAAVFTWHGCKFEYSGKPTEYVSEETPMSTYANLHFALESERSKNKSPSILVLGARNSGKTTLCKILSAYANKSGEYYPMLVNLDSTQGVFSVPGGLSAAPVSDVLDVEDGWGAAPINGPAVLHSKSPLVYFYGLESPLTNAKYYTHVVSRLSIGIRARLDEDPRVRKSGLIIDTPAALVDAKQDASYTAVSSIVADLRVSAIAVVGNERLYADMSKKFKNKLTVLKVPKSGGCVDRDDTFIRIQQKQAIHDYFYGNSRQSLAPYTITVDYSAISAVYRVAEGTTLNASVTTDDDDSTGEALSSSAQFLVKLEASSILQNCVMAMLNASPTDTPDVLVQSEVLGYVHVVEANDDKQKMKVLMPVPGHLPSRPFVIGDYRYVE